LVKSTVIALFKVKGPRHLLRGNIDFGGFADGILYDQEQFGHDLNHMPRLEHEVPLPVHLGMEETAHLMMMVMGASATAS
jgi:hypothetical protein